MMNLRVKPRFLGAAVALVALFGSGAAVADGPALSMTMAQSGVYDSSAGSPEAGAVAPSVTSVTGSGTLNTAYPFALPKARGSAQPKLGLQYSAGSRGVAGFGWELATPRIERRNISGGPRYNDPIGGQPLNPDTVDQFVFNGDPLVPICLIAPGGACRGAAEVMPPFTLEGGWHYFRLANDTSLARFFWRGDHLTWVVQFKSGEVYELGRSISTSFVPESIDYDDHIVIDSLGQVNRTSPPFRWNIVFQHDAQVDELAPSRHVNHVLYVWQRQHANRANLAYLTDVFDTLAVSGINDKNPLSSYAHHVRLTYEAPPKGAVYDLADPPVWRARPELVLSHVDLTSANPGNEGARELLRRYWLDYAAYSGRAYLHGVQLEGRCAPPPRESVVDGSLPEATNCLRLPATTFEYLWPPPLFNVRPVFGVVPDNAFIFDLNQDGVADFVGSSLDAQTPQAFALNSTGIAADTLGLHGTMSVGVSSLGADTKRLTPLSSRVGSGILSANGLPGLAALGVLEGDTHSPPLGIETFVPKQVATSLWTWARESGVNTGLDPTSYNGICVQFPIPPPPQEPVYYPCFRTGYRPLATTDFDNDGYPDAYFLNISGPLGQDDAGATVFAGGSVSVRTTVRNRNGTLAAFGRLAQSFGFPTLFSGHLTNPKTSPVAQGKTFFEDMDADGLPDWVSVQGNTVFYWRGLGDGTANFCGLGQPIASCGDADIVAHAKQVTGLPDSLFYALHDVNGDSLPDAIAYGTAADQKIVIRVYFNQEGRFFGPPFTVDTAQIPGFVPGRTRIVLGDVNGSGNDDLVFLTDNSASYVDLLSDVPLGFLRRISNGLGGTTDIQYASTASLARCSRGAAECDGPTPLDGKAWTTQSPQAIHAVTRITTNNNLPGSQRLSRVSEYSYTDPIWDGRDLQFRGFQRIRTRTRGEPSDSRDPPITTETTYLSGKCEVDFVNGSCPVDSIDLPFDALAGRPVLVETYDDARRFLSTVHQQYRVVRPLVSMDQRAVRFAYAAQTDTFLYDPGVAASAGSRITLDDAFFEESSDHVSRSVVLRVGRGNPAVHLRTTTIQDQFGNTVDSIDYGRLGADQPVHAWTSWGLPQNDLTGWLWRPATKHLDASAPRLGLPPDQPRDVRYTYDGSGNVATVTAALRGSTSLQRRHQANGAVAPSPATASLDGDVRVQWVRYDSFGNPTQQRGPNDVRCETTTFDEKFAQFAVGHQVFIEPGCSGAAITKHQSFDRGFERPTLSVAADGSMTSIEYDPFGRPTVTRRPDPVTGIPGAATMVAYFDVPHVLADARPQLSRTTVFDGTRDVTSWSYSDGFGTPLFLIESADVAAGDPAGWVLSNAVERSPKGAAVVKHQTQFYDGDPQAYPIANGFSSPGTSSRYDAFGRMLELRDERGNLTTRRAYHALSVEVFDADTAPGGARAGMSATVEKDGHGRTIRTSKRMRVGTTPDVVSTTTSYSAAGLVRSIDYTHGASVAPFTRTMGYDSLGRLVSNREPNTSFTSPIGHRTFLWIYAYDDDGDLVGTSDARGCGKNASYDAAGRPVFEDYSPCLIAHDVYSPPAASGSGMEVQYAYEGGSLPSGRLREIFDRSSHTSFEYDLRGRTRRVSKSLAKPGIPELDPTSRYAAHVFVAEMEYDALDRISKQSTGADVSELLGIAGLSTVTPQYSARGLVSSMLSSYGTLIASASYAADGLPLSRTLGDAAKTTTTSIYDDPIRRLRTSTITRTAPAFWSQSSAQYPSPDPSEPTQQLEFENVTFDYDAVGNPRSALDSSDPGRWPLGAKPRALHYEYDDAYRVSRVSYGNADAFVSPYSWEALSGSGSPVPGSTAAARLSWQTYSYDWLGNLAVSNDDEGLFYDRSFGNAIYTSSGGPFGLGAFQPPNQIVLAESPGGSGGVLLAQHDLSGNMSELRVIRRAPCLVPAGCNQRFIYDWNEVGQLARARRFDFVSVSLTPDPSDPFYGVPPTVAAAQLDYSYDASGQRVLKHVTLADRDPQTSAQIFPTLRLDHAAWDKNSTDYERDRNTESVYLAAGSGALARVVYAETPLPTLGNELALNAHLRVFFTLTDRLGSTNFVVDKETGELVERATYQAFGATEADYRPARWQHFRETYRFTGKEDDTEVGLQYFGARYLSPALGQWISPDPLAIHGLQGSNPYAYVNGRVSFDVDSTGMAGQGDDIVTDPSDTIKAGQFIYQNLSPDWIALGLAFAEGSQTKDPLTAFAAGVVNLPTDTLKAAATVAWLAETGIRKGLGLSASSSLGEVLQSMPNIVEPPRTDFVAYGLGGLVAGAVVGEVIGAASAGLRAVGEADVVATRVAGFTEELSAAASGLCFEAGTAVWTEHGQQPIETLKIGDRVITRDEAKGELSASAVIRTFARPADDLVAVSMQDGRGVVSVLHPTAGHRIWTYGRGWVPAAELRVGDELWTVRGPASVWRKPTHVPVSLAVYNIEVQQQHTYLAGADGVWVHNTCPQAQAGLDDLATFRTELGLEPGKGTLARLDIGDKSFYGINAHGQEVGLVVHPIPASHAETDVFNQAFRIGNTEKSATLFVDRPLCIACDQKGAVRSMARQIGLTELSIVTPQGVRKITP